MERGRSSGVEHYLAKVRVVSSNLIARSIDFFLEVLDWNESAVRACGGRLSMPHTCVADKRRDGGECDDGKQDGAQRKRSLDGPRIGEIQRSKPPSC